MEAAGGGAAPGCIDLHDFSGQLGEQRVHFHAMRLQDSLFLWVGVAPALSSLAVAMCSPRDSVPVSTSLLGDPSDTASVCLAQRLGTCGAAGLRDRTVPLGWYWGRWGAPCVGRGLCGVGRLPAGQECFWWTVVASQNHRISRVGRGSQEPSSLAPGSAQQHPKIRPYA
uniref:Proteasome assembly chaperone 4 n=1 Tax=Pavo cristatus TaxID=9049 RepID=A0A8C9G714_PAVCR